MGILEEGIAIKVNRSDGRTQTAFVSSIDFTLNYVKVEWFEDGETKGKEVHFNSIVDLNPDIIICKKTQKDLVDCEIPNKIVNNQCNKISVIVNQEQRAQSAKPRLCQNKFAINDTAVSNQLTVEGKRITNATSSHSAIENICRIKESGTIKRLSQLEKDRIERRKRNAEVKAYKDEMSKKCQDNPHWELMNMINRYRVNLKLNPLSKNDVIEDHLITVAVRKRPLNTLDVTKKEIDIITVPSKNQLIIHEPRFKLDLTKYLENHFFKFDYVFNQDCSNEIVYKYTAQPLIKTVFAGGFATCFAYGQTGSGKTYTMSGDMENDGEKGIYALAAADIFKEIKSYKNNNLDFCVSCSFFEIYVKKVSDLLNGKKDLKILEDGRQQVQVVGLTEKTVNSVDDVLQLIEIGNEERASGQTSANAKSSRSHAIFQIYLRTKSNLKKVYGKFSLIDLAGNERGADTFSSSRITRLEGSEINQSLLSLKECIRALGRKGPHLPFRGSKLTQVLRDSFVGVNSKTCMIAMVSPGVSSCENTLNTLRYADRVKELGGGDACMNKSPDVMCNEETISSFYSTRSVNTFTKPESLECDSLSSSENIKPLPNDICVPDEKVSYVEEVIKTLKVKLEEAENSLSKCSDNRNTYCHIWNQFIEDAVSILLDAKL